ncbi:glycosyltransferase family 4 protein [Flavobacterium sp. T12S277]|uniref:glycosyltransferase family 4 protein n=1 Tax=Flavobacterium sp. T12S277 TaxID=3402752 RepID=UPI003AF0B0EB
MKKVLKKKARKTLNFFSALYYLLLFCLFENRKIRKSDIVFFFPVYHTGGAERVHLNIVKSVQGKKSCVLFTQNSNTVNFLASFQKLSEVILINKIVTKKNKLLIKVLKKIIIKSLNKNHNLETVFSSNATFFYELLPFLDQRINKIDLIHAFSYPDLGIEDDSISAVEYLDYRVVINEKTKLDLISQYKTNNIDSAYNERIIKIENGIEIDDNSFYQKDAGKIKIGFVGRWAHEKRPELFLQIAKNVIPNFPNAQFEMLGTGMKSNKKSIDSAGVLFLGEVTNKDSLREIYKNMTFLLITSSREGFPMVIMEAMAHGVVPITTNVGGITEHIVNDENGIVIDDTDEQIIVEKFTASIAELIMNINYREKIAQNAYLYAHNNFQIQKFNDSYKKLLFRQTDLKNEHIFQK